MRDTVHFLDFAALYNEQSIGNVNEPDTNTVALMILMPDSDSPDEAVDFLGFDVEGEEGVTLFNVKYCDKQIVWQGRNGKKVGLDLRKTALADMPLTHFMPAFFIAQDARTGVALSQGAMQVVDLS